MSRLLASRRVQLSISRSNSISHGRKVLRCILPRSNSWMRRLNCAKTVSLSGSDSYIMRDVVLALVYSCQPSVDGLHLFEDLGPVSGVRFHGEILLQIAA